MHHTMTFVGVVVVASELKKYCHLPMHCTKSIDDYYLNDPTFVVS